MKLTFHIGKCCGIKTIYDLGLYPDCGLPALKACKLNNTDQYGQAVSSETRFFHEAAPAETYLERLDRYLEYVDRRRPEGIVEIVLGAYLGTHQRPRWEEILLARDFKLVSSSGNSNSGATIYVYHRYSGVAEKIPKSRLKPFPPEPEASATKKAATCSLRNIITLDVE